MSANYSALQKQLSLLTVQWTWYKENLITFGQIVFSELDNPPTSPEIIRGIQSQSLLREKDTDIDGVQAMRLAYAPFRNAPDELSARAPSGLESDVVMINGDYDVETPLFVAQRYSGVLSLDRIERPF